MGPSGKKKSPAKSTAHIGPFCSAAMDDEAAIPLAGLGLTAAFLMPGLILAQRLPPPVAAVPAMLVMGAALLVLTRRAPAPSPG